ncbi:hydantoinase/oxoprolinase N-terminal domain-containing protein [Maridesulfovibrio hydrothermalis]|uniref:Hydantoinaseoxoprolinase domain protein n=1 Tax=Maridesulfovibrio hydrothermalis AM13 = DSM 14728 TaxID=1121451 RepID=L0RCC3_9BACT|nr:hydantoinase/oxoprolinase family protein [Maridesulfovibrio hydrothermalis]CCO23872.1 Hydantoinaseoxoprolinase domain protein [Maridesulfovibrio hydrothermalis AM13 = DSM 14728]
MSFESGYAIGIDTGGTYTDTVVVNCADSSVVATAKSPTTHHDLSLGLASSLDKAMTASGINPDEVNLVSVSTTLATNAVVENKGARVGLFMIGSVKALKLPVVTMRFVKGGHKITGAEDDPLDIESLVDGVNDMRGHVDSYAVCAAMSFKNPAHELIAQKAISLTDPNPVFCSHTISTRAGQRERAATAVLNARLMPVMKEFLAGVGKALDERKLGSAVVVVRGNATSMSMDDAVSRAAETFASGPASTAYYGSIYSPARDALIVDVGGTTTDVTLIRDFRPTIEESGSIIGEWETHVEAVEMFTVGVGGDSFSRITRSGNLEVGPGRVMPLCMAGDIPAPEKWIGRGHDSHLIKAGPAAGENDSSVLAYLRENGAATFTQIMEGLEVGEIKLGGMVEKLVRAQFIDEVGFTPTDALHVLGKIDIGDGEKSVAAAKVLGAELGLDAQGFADKVLAETRLKIENAMLEHIVRKEIGGNMAGIVAGRSASPLVRFEVSLNLPIVGIGAAAGMLLPEVAHRLHTEAVFPDHHEVGNALGAVRMALDNMKKESR